MRVHTVAIAVAVFVSRCAMADAQELRGKIRITILYDNTLSVRETTADWGFSCFIQSAGDTILFDGGTVDTILLRNAHDLGVDLSTTKRIFLSHDHFDHAGGSGVPSQKRRACQFT